MMDFLISKAYAVSGTNTAKATGGDAFKKLLNKILENIVIPVVYLVMALAIVYFLWGVMVFIQNADNAEKRQEGYKHMIYGVIGIFIIISARGIIKIIGSTIGV